MKLLRSILVVLLVLVAASVCVRLGFWQLSRWHEKRALNQALQRALSAPPKVLGPKPSPQAKVLGTRVEARGRYDESRQVLLGARPHLGEPGVEVVTPLLLEGGSSAVLVNRGWLYSADAATAHPQESPEPGLKRVVGLAEPLGRGLAGPALRILEGDSVTLYSARRLDWDTLSRRMPYALAPFVLRQTPGPGVPDRPLRIVPRPANEAMHLSYTVQWFAFAAILLGGSSMLAWSRRGAHPGS
jgi:surfeit locus 1 family protein